MKTIKEPWFIGSVGGFFCAIISIFVIVIACRRRKRKRPSYFCEQSNGIDMIRILSSYCDIIDISSYYEDI